MEFILIHAGPTFQIHDTLESGLQHRNFEKDSDYSLSL